LLAAHLAGGFEFQDSAAFIGRIIRTAPFGRVEFEPNPAPDDAHDHVGARHPRDGIVDRFLKGLCGGIERIFPAQSLDIGDALEFAVEAFDYRLRAIALGPHIRGRGDKKAKAPFSQGPNLVEARR